MRREHLKARLLRALSGKTQDQIGLESGVHPDLIKKVEIGKILPGQDHLTRLARTAGLSVSDAEEIMRLYETLRGSPRSWARRGRRADDIIEGMVEALRAHVSATYRRLLTRPLPDRLPKAEDRLRAGELLGRLVELSPETRLAVVRVATEYQSWALCELVCQASVREASRDLEHAAAWARLGQEIADRVRGPEGWRDRMKAYAGGHSANILRIAGEVQTAEVAFDRAKRQWAKGSDPGGVLDAGRILDLEASLRRAQRRFEEALTLLDEAVAVGRCPERALINKGFTLEVMGEYERALGSLLQAEPLVKRDGDPRLLYMLHFNTAVIYCHLGRYAEAAELAQQVCHQATEQGDEIEAIRVTWLRGRIAAGLGHPEEARTLLGEARRAFSLRGMSYDVALALLEEIVLVLGEGASSEAKGLARELTEVFESKGVHREAMAALRLFHEAVLREEATAELARHTLRFLFRARNDEALRFEL